jgi:hypothetical protein
MSTAAINVMFKQESLPRLHMEPGGGAPGARKIGPAGGAVRRESDERASRHSADPAPAASKCAFKVVIF